MAREMPPERRTRGKEMGTLEGSINPTGAGRGGESGIIDATL